MIVCRWLFASPADMVLPVFFPEKICTLMWRSAGLIFFCVFGALPGLFAQKAKVDTVLQIREVTVSAGRLAGAEAPALYQIIDTNELRPPGMRQLAQLLAGGSGWYLKNYGPGGVQSPSFRGGNSAQTSLQWAGWELNSPLTGQADLSTIPAAFIDRVAVSPAGAVELQQLPVQAGDPAFTFSQEFGSFGLAGFSGAWKTGRPHWDQSTSVLWQGARNDFLVDYPGVTPRRQPHAAFRQTACTHRQRWRPSPRSEWTLLSWFADQQRQTPPTLLQQRSAAEQADRQYRISAETLRSMGVFTGQAAVAWLGEEFHYADSLIDLDSRSRTDQWRARASLQWGLAPRHELRGGLEGGYTRAHSTEYFQATDRRQLTARLRYHWHSSDGFWNLRATGQQEWVDGRAMPAGADLTLNTQRFNHTWSLYLFRAYRLPTLNDWYWSPGGNPELEAETSWGASLGWHYRRPASIWQTARLELFHRMTDDWIIWLPAGSIWTPENLRQVWSRGLEAGLTFGRETTHWSWRSQWRYSLILATNRQTEHPNDASLHKQLIYVPRHRAQADLTLGFGQWSLSGAAGATGRVYTLNDHSAHLPPTLLFDLDLQYRQKRGKLQGQFYLQLFNLFDQHFQTVAGYPLPGRHFRLGWHWQIR